MRIAMASEGKYIESKVSEFAGRSPFYLVFEDNELSEVIKNPFLNQRGVGFKIPNLLFDKKINLFIAENFGGNMEESLNKKI